MKITKTLIEKLLDKEIAWCKANYKLELDTIHDNNWKDGFIEGLKHAKILIEGISHAK